MTRFRTSLLAVVALVVVSCSTSVDGSVSEPASTQFATSTTAATTTTSLPSEFSATKSEIGLGWEAIELPETIAACHQAVIPTDEEILFWGGNRDSCAYESPVGDPGLAYNVDEGSWRHLPDGPLQSVVAPTGVWTGEEVLICCGIAGIAPMGGSEGGSNQTAAYDPSTDSWRTLADAPLGAPFPESVWTGDEMVVATQHGSAAYDPATNTWREFPPAPENLGRANEVVWTGEELVVWPRWPNGPVLRRVTQGMALDPRSGDWRVLPDPPAGPTALDMVFTDDSLLIWGGLPAHSGGSERAVGSRYDLDAHTWAPVSEVLPEPDGCECNLGSQTLTWTGDYVLVSPGWFSSGVDPDTPVLIAYHPESDEWILVDEESPLAWGGVGFRVGERLAIAAGELFYVSPPKWQPTGEPITQDTWNE